MKDKEFHYIISPTLAMRNAPNEQSEMVSQALFSENVAIVEEQPEWIKIQTSIDGYQGWVKKEGVCYRKTLFLSEAFLTPLVVCRLAAHVYENPDTLYGPFLTLPFESRLGTMKVENDESRWLPVCLPDFRQVFIQRGDIAKKILPILNCEEMCEFSLSFLGLPYTWGGRSSFGYDCSGFVQMLYRQMGVFLPRDAKDQMMFSKFQEIPIKDLNPGDLIFFGFSKNEIRHVGLALGSGKFIHTSAVTENMPYIRVSHVEDSPWNGSGYYPFSLGMRYQRSI